MFSDAVIQEAARRILRDIIVVSEDSVREWRDAYGTVINSAVREGRELAA